MTRSRPLLLIGVIAAVVLVSTAALLPTFPFARASLIVTGRVTTADGAPLAGAQISVTVPRAGATTDSEGMYVLRLERDAITGDSLEIGAAFIGFERSSRRVGIDADTLHVNFTMAPRLLSLDKIVVTGMPDATAPVRTPFAVSRAGEKAAGAPTAPPFDAQYRVFFQGARAMSTETGRSADASSNRRPDPDFNTESYDRIYENPFLAVEHNVLSTFSIDVDRASYGNVRRFIHDGQRPPADAVRIEELINYFRYHDPEPTGVHPFAVRTEIAPAPWRPEHLLLRIGLQARRIETEDLPPANLVFLVDVSGSMTPDNKLPLLKRSLALLVEQLREEDRVAIVVYAGAAGLVLPSTPGSEKTEIMAALERLRAGGSTAGGAGIRLAYDIARKYHVEGGNNRVILATDGDFNVGASSDAEMVRLIEDRRRQGTFLTVLGFGTGNLKDSKMEALADHGNGNYAYIDGLSEARKVLVHEMGGTLLTLAKDVKLQVEFNSAAVAAYRLIGYENRLLRAEDFDDDTKDAGELGAGHAVTALYELIPVGVESEVEVRHMDPLRYRRQTQPTAATQNDEIGYVKLRYKQPNADESVLFDHVIATPRDVAPSTDFTFASAVAAFGLVLRDSEYRGSATIDQVVALARDGKDDDPEGYRADFIRLAEAVSHAPWARAFAQPQDGERERGR